MTELRSEVELTDPAALRAFAHPVRLALIGLLRREGPMTATQAAGKLGESVPTCSFHLRQLAKYGLVERVEGVDAREKPWRATALSTRWGSSPSDDPEMNAAEDQLNAVLMRRYYDQAIAWLGRRHDDPPQWRALTGAGDALLYLTAEELADLMHRQDELAAEFRERRSDPSLRPPGSRAVSIAQFITTAE